jgi:hypothetical protein
MRGEPAGRPTKKPAGVIGHPYRETIRSGISTVATIDGLTLKRAKRDMPRMVAFSSHLPRTMAKTSRANPYSEHVGATGGYHQYTLSINHLDRLDPLSQDAVSRAGRAPAFRFGKECTVTDHTKIFSHGADRVV